MNVPDNTTPYRASDYDKSVRQTIPFYETIHSQTVDILRNLRPEARLWLDTGCGTGYLAGLAAPYFPHTRFVLSDPSQAMLALAKLRLAGMADRVEFLAPTPTENLDTEAAQVHPQIVTSILAHHYLHGPQRLRATLVCYQLLEAGGVFVTAENIRPVPETIASLELSRWKQFQIEQGRSPADAASHVKRFDADYFPISIDEHLTLLRETGFSQVTLFWVSHMQAGFYAIK